MMLYREMCPKIFLSNFKMKRMEIVSTLFFSDKLSNSKAIMFVFPIKSLNSSKGFFVVLLIVF